MATFDAYDAATPTKLVGASDELPRVMGSALLNVIKSSRLLICMAVACAFLAGAGVGWLAAVWWEPQEERLARRMVLANRRYTDCKATALATFYAVPASADAELRTALQRHLEHELGSASASLKLDDVITIVLESDTSAEGRLRKQFDHKPKKFIRDQCQREEDEVEVMRLALRLSRPR